jgi:PLP dependent protein
MSIQHRLSEVQATIRQYATASSVTLVAVSKYASIEQVMEAYDAGIRHFGENKVQDALSKMEQLPAEYQQEIHWHFIGNLQSNKAKKTVGRFALIHSIDSFKLAEVVSRYNVEENLKQPVLLQVNLSDDPDRHGFMPDEVDPALRLMLGLDGIVVRGLMGMAPQEVSLGNDSEVIKSVFCKLRDLRDHLERDLKISLPELSMGMSQDFTHALTSGATIIRIGNYLFKN